MCLFNQDPDESAETINLSQKVPIAPTEGTVAVAEAEVEAEAEATDEEITLPEWSEKVSSGILTGELTHHRNPSVQCSAHAVVDL